MNTNYYFSDFIPGLLSSILAVIGRFLMNFGHIITLQYSAEIIPTVVRGQGLNLMHVLGCIASIVANIVVQMVSGLFRKLST